MTDVHSPSDSSSSPRAELVNAQTRMLLDRRNVLRAAGIVALAGGGAAALGACSPMQPTSTPSVAPSSAASSSASPSSAAPSSPSPSSASPSPSPSKTSKAPVPTGPSVAAADVPVGSGVIMDEPDDYVVTQPTKGKYKAFTAICTHQQCRVSELRDDRIICVCHNSQFSIKDGSVLQDPAEEPLKEFDVTVSGKKVYVQD